MALDGAWIALAGTIVGGVIGVAGKAFSDWLAVSKDREAREHQRKADFEKWQREQLLVCVTASMRVVNRYIARAVSFKDSGNDVVPLQNDPDIREASAEVQAQLTAIVFRRSRTTSVFQFPLSHNSGCVRGPVEPVAGCSSHVWQQKLKSQTNHGYNRPSSPPKQVQTSRIPRERVTGINRITDSQ